MNFSEPSCNRGDRSEPSGKRGRRSSLRERKQTKKIMAFKKRRHCRGPHALEVTNVNAMASNLPRTCFKSESLPNSVIFLTEVHLHVFLTLCSSSNLGKSLWTWWKTWEARSTRSSLDHKNYIPNCYFTPQSRSFVYLLPLLPESLTSERLCQLTDVSEDILSFCFKGHCLILKSHIYHWFT